MNRSILSSISAIFLIAPRIGAQALIHDSLYSVLGVSSVQTIILNNGDTTLRELKRYRDGFQVAFHYSTPPGKYNVDIHDTLLFRGGGNYSCIDRGDRRTYDSSNTYHTIGYSDTVKTTYYKNGKVVIQKITVPTKEKDRIFNRYFESTYSETRHTETRKFNDAGMLAEKEVSDSLFKGKKKEEKARYVHHFLYTPVFSIQHVYKTCADTMCRSYTAYTSYDHSFDSTIMYADNENVEYYFAIYRDAEGRDSLSVTRDGNGVITNRNRTTHSPGYTITEHADGTGFVFKTHEWYFNDKGLVVKEVETDHKFGDVRTLYYTYTFF